MKMKIVDFERLVIKALRKKYNNKDSRRIAEVLLFGELSGKKSHGIVRLIKGASSMIAQNPSGSPILKKRTKLSSIIDSNENPAMLIGAMACEEVIKIAKKYYFGIVGTYDTQSTTGCLSYYLEKIANQNLIAIVMARSSFSLAPFNSIEPIFGTNPIGFGIPANPKPFIFDMGSSAISFGALFKAQATNEKLPQGVAIDSEGHETTDPTKAIQGAVLPFDKSYKSSGLAMIVEILAGLWPLAGYVKHEEGGWGNIYIAMKPELLMDTDEFKNKMQKFIKMVRNSKTKDSKKVRIPGEQTVSSRDKAIDKDEVEVAEELVEMVRHYIKTNQLPI